MAEAIAGPATATKPEPMVAAPPPAAVTAVAEGDRKRKLESGEFQQSGYFKLRCLVKDLRPLFVEMIQAPDIGRSNLALDIQNQMKTMTELLQRLKDEMACDEKVGKPSETDSSFQVVEEEISENDDPEKAFTSSENNSSVQAKKEEACDKTSAATTNTVEEVVQDEGRQELTPQGLKVTGEDEHARELDEVSQGTYVIGGSILGWNFLVYPGGKPVYYGVTKESALARRVKE